MDIGSLWKRQFNPFRVVLVLGRSNPRALPSVGISFPFGESQRNIAIQLCVLGLVDNAHPATTELL